MMATSVLVEATENEFHTDADFISFDKLFAEDEEENPVIKKVKSKNSDHIKSREKGETLPSPPKKDSAKDREEGEGSNSDNQQEPQPLKLNEDHFMTLDPLTPLPIPPWIPAGRKYSKTLITLLDEEIEDYIDYISPTRSEHELRRLTISRISIAAKAVWPNCAVAVFGSFDTKLYLPSSDIDVVIFSPECQQPSCLWKLKQSLEKHDFVLKVEVIDKAKVPILKIVDSFTRYPVDISFNIANGVQGATIVKAFLQDRGCTALRPLMLILKQFLAQRFLNEVFTGGLGSYGLLTMIAAFLKLHPKIQAREIDPLENLGILLLEFLELYGKHFNYDDVGISVTLAGASYFSRVYDNPFPNPFGRPGVISIMDPQDSENDISRGSYNFRVIKHEFMRAYDLLVCMLGSAFERDRDSLDRSDGNHRPIVGTLLGSILTVRREVLEHRDYIEDLWEGIQRGDIELDPLWLPAEGEDTVTFVGLQQPSQSKPHARSLEYVIDDSSADEIALREASTHGQKKKKRKHSKAKR